jgi:hypothetical protein
MSDIEEAKKLLMAITRRTHNDMDITSAIRLLLSDYIERASGALADAAKLTPGKEM